MSKAFQKIVFDDFVSNTAETSIISIGEITPIQLILKHAPIAGGVGFNIAIKRNMASAYEVSPIIESNVNGAIKKVYNFPNGLKYTFLQFKLDTANTVSKYSPELVLIYDPCDMEALAKQSNAPDFTVDVTGVINPVIVAGTLVFRGAYNGATDYAVGDTVSYLGSSYVLYVDVGAGTLPTDTTKWQILAEQGDQGSPGIQGLKGDNGDLDGGSASAIFSASSLINGGNA